jgi:hypothetical protein
MALRQLGRSQTGIERYMLLAWVPVVAFLLLNAFVFALLFDLVHVRYALSAHTVLLMTVYRGALGWTASENTLRARPVHPTPISAESVRGLARTQ